MSIRWLGKSRGLVIECNGCGAKYTTGNVVAKHVRDWIRKHDGWTRGLRNATAARLSTKRHDYCPTCTPVERKAYETEQAEKAERRKQRDEARKAKLAPKPKKEPKLKKPRKSKGSAASPSADSHPAPAS